MCNTCGCNGSPTVTKATSEQNEKTGGPAERSPDVQGTKRRANRRKRR